MMPSLTSFLILVNSVLLFNLNLIHLFICRIEMIRYKTVVF